MEEPSSLPGLPFPLRWRPTPERWHVADDDGTLSITAGAGTDLFADPRGGAPAVDAPRLLGSPPVGDFQLSARVTVGFATTFDAGVLLVHADDRRWAKLCFERSPQDEALVVSVVTRGVFDDAHPFAVAGRQVWLRISRLGPAYAFHPPGDGTSWRFVRLFALEAAGDVAVGFLAQSPTGAGCTAVFDRVFYRTERLPDLRSGV